MQLELDPFSPVPIYQQIRDRIVEAVARGILVPGDQLAPVRQLALDFGINAATVAKGYDALRNEGIIRTNYKSGSVIARGPDAGEADPSFVRDWTARLTTLLAEATAKGLADGEILEATTTLIRDFSSSRSRPDGPDAHHGDVERDAFDGQKGQTS